MVAPPEFAGPGCGPPKSRPKIEPSSGSPLDTKDENPNECWGFQWRRREFNSGESPESANIQRSCSAGSESHETENGRERPPGAAELAARQGDGGRDDAEDDVDALFAQAARSSADTALAFGSDNDAEDGVGALFEQAARSSSALIAFGLDEEL